MSGSDWIVGDECPQNIIAGLALGLASFRREASGIVGDLVIDQNCPSYVDGTPNVRRGDFGDVKIIIVGIEDAIVGEAVGFGGRVESVGRGVAGVGVGAVVEAVTRVANARGGSWEEYVARAGRHGTLEDCVVLAFDAEVDCIGTKTRFNGDYFRIGALEVSEGADTYVDA